MKVSSFWISAVSVLVAASCILKSEGATVNIKARNLAGRELTYNRSYDGVFLATYTPVPLDADSTCIIDIPSEGIERMMIMANDPAQELASVHKSFYVLPGTTDVTIDPFSEESIVIAPPTGNKFDGNAATSADGFYDLWIALSTRRKDSLGLWADSIPATVTAKLEAYGDSIINAYSAASPEIKEAVVNDVRIESLMVFLTCHYFAKDSRNAADWRTELARLREKVDVNAPSNACNPYFADYIARDLFRIDTYPDLKYPAGISVDSILRQTVDYYIRTMHGKTAECAIGSMLYGDAAKNAFSPGAPALTERFKELFPKSRILPFLVKGVEENIAFNNPEESDEIVFLDNSGIKTVAELLAPFKGTPVLIDLWATWCKPCLESFSHVGPIQEYAAENGVQLLYLSVDDRPGIEERWKRLAHFHNLKGHHVLINPDFKMEVFSTFGDNGCLLVPRFAIVDREGNISLCPQPLSEMADFAPLRTLLDKTVMAE